MKALATRPAQEPVYDLTPETVDLIKRTICKGATDEELRLFLHQARRTRLDPLNRQIYAVKRWDGSVGRHVMQVQISIDGLRLLAERSGKYKGQLGPHWCDADGEWHEAWLWDKPPTAARVAVLRSDFAEPIWQTARYNSYVQRTREGKPTSMWTTMADVMIAKCAESLALRKAFPFELSGLYSAEEMDQETGEVLERPAPREHEPPQPAPNPMQQVEQQQPSSEEVMAHDNALAEAAQLGTEPLRKAWEAIPPPIQHMLEAALRRRHKIVAEAVDAEGAQQQPAS